MDCRTLRQYALPSKPTKSLCVRCVSLHSTHLTTWFSLGHGNHDYSPKNEVYSFLRDYFLLSLLSSIWLIFPHIGLVKILKYCTWFAVSLSPHSLSICPWPRSRPPTAPQLLGADSRRWLSGPQCPGFTALIWGGLIQVVVLWKHLCRFLSCSFGISLVKSVISISIDSTAQEYVIIL